MKILALIVLIICTSLQVVFLALRQQVTRFLPSLKRTKAKPQFKRKKKKAPKPKPKRTFTEDETFLPYVLVVEFDDEGNHIPRYHWLDHEGYAPAYVDTRSGQVLFAVWSRRKHRKVEKAAKAANLSIDAFVKRRQEPSSAHTIQQDGCRVDMRD
jgi:hypothetical protein